MSTYTVRVENPVVRTVKIKFDRVDALRIRQSPSAIAHHFGWTGKWKLFDALSESGEWELQMDVWESHHQFNEIIIGEGFGLQGIRGVEGTRGVRSWWLEKDPYYTSGQFEILVELNSRLELITPGCPEQTINLNRQI